MTDDLIKRSDALSAAGDMSYIAYEIRKKIRMIPPADTPYKVLAHIDLDPDEVVERMKGLQIEVNSDAPTVEQKCGHWIYHFDDLFPAESTQECSVCHEEEFMSICNENFCPNCGARMVKPDE